MADKNDMDAIMNQVYEDLKTLGYVSKETSDRLKDAEQKAKVFEAALGNGGKAVDALGRAFASTATAMYRGEKGASAFNKSITDMADAAQLAATGLALLIPGGPLLKGVVAGLTYLATSAIKAGAELTKAANEQSDKLYEAFQKMSVSGAAASDGMTGIFNDLQNLGIGIQDLDGYINLLNESSRDLALFGGSVYKGRQAFADMNEQMKPFTEQLYNAGMTQQDINKGAMSYLRLQTQIGRSQTMTAQQLAEGARKYLIEQDALTKLTGQSRQEAEQEMEAARSEQRFRAKLEAMRNSGDERQIKAADELEKANRLLSSQSKQAGQGFRDLSTGMVTSEAAQKALISSNGVALEQSQKMAEGQVTAIDGVQQMAKAFGQNAKDMNALAQAGVYEDIGIQFSDAVKLGIFSEQDLATKLKDINDEIERQGVTGKKAADELQQTQTEIRKQQRDAMLATQELVQLAVPAATTAMLSLATAANTAAQALLKTAKAKEPVEAQRRAETAYANSEAVGAAGEVGQISAEGQIAAGKEVVPQNIKSVKDMNWLEKFLVGKKEVARREAAEAAGQTPAQAAAGSAPSAPVVPSGQTKPQQPGAQPAGGTVSSYSDKLLQYIRDTEQFTPKAYWDKKQYSNGYGTKANSPDEVIDKVTAEARLRDSLQQAVGTVISHGQRYNYKWTQGQVDALTSFVYNLGPGQLDNLTKQGKRSIDEISQSLLLYNKARDEKTRKTEIVPGLTRRREEELRMFQGARDGGVFDGPKSGYPMTLHGMEAVIPLKDGAVPVTMSQEFSTNVSNMSELVDIMKSNAVMQDRMIAVLEDIRRSQNSTADHTGRLAAVAAN